MFQFAAGIVLFLGHERHYDISRMLVEILPVAAEGAGTRRLLGQAMDREVLRPRPTGIAFSGGRSWFMESSASAEYGREPPATVVPHSPGEVG